MGERWESILLVIILLVALASPVLAHKFPIVEYTYVGHIWEEAYLKIPAQPVVGERITIRASVKHPGEKIEGNVTSVFAIYRDDTRWDWYGGKPYKNPDWIVLKDVPGQPTGEHDPSQDIHEFETTLVVDEAASYKVFIDWYENRQYIGQSMHTLDIERRSIGPMFVVFNALLILGVLYGVRRGIL